MKVLLLFLLFTLVYRIYADCPNGTFPNASGGKCYFIPNESSQFVPAEMSCQDQNGNLASILNAFDNNGLTANASNLLGLSVTYVWLGGRKDRKGTWIWTDGQNFTYTHWANGNPGNNNDDNCMILNLWDGLWYSHNCYHILPYICDFSQTITTITTNPTTPTIINTQCPDGWTYYSNTNFCYMFDQFATTFSNAEQMCQQSNGHLISIHSEDENNFLGQFVTNDGLFWIGLSYNSSLSHFIWTDNTPYYDYNDWYFGQPNTTFNQLCAFNGGFDHSFAWYTQLCNDTLSFVCKKPPNF